MLVVFNFVQLVAPVTVTLNVHVALAASVAPVRVIVFGAVESEPSDVRERSESAVSSPPEAPKKEEITEEAIAEVLEFADYFRRQLEDENEHADAEEIPTDFAVDYYCPDDGLNVVARARIVAAALRNIYSLMAASCAINC